MVAGLSQKQGISGTQLISSQKESELEKFGVRKAQVTENKGLINSAIKFIRDYLNENSLGPEDMEEEPVKSRLLGSLFDSWRMQEDVSEKDMSLWQRALESAKKEMETGLWNPEEEGVHEIFDVPVKASNVFTVSSALEVEKNRKQLMRLVERVIEYNAVDKNPADLTKTDVSDFLEEGFRKCQERNEIGRAHV